MARTVDTTTVNTTTARISSHDNMMKKKKEAADCPIFLRKTYHMIDSCDESIGSWAEDGETFVIKNTDRFARDIIPQFFKHNNFSSFVRQLNFYGFRKIKNDPIKIVTDKRSDIESKYWRFRHEKFIQGRPDLLIEIRKSNQNQIIDQEEVNRLRDEVYQLKDVIKTMRCDIESLTSLVTTMSKSLVEKDTQVDQSFPNKRRRFEPNQVLSIPMQTQSMGSYVPPSAVLLKGFKSREMVQPPISMSMPMKRVERLPSEVSETIDFVDELLASPLAAEDVDELLASPLAAEDEAALLREIAVERSDECVIDHQPFPNLVCSSPPSFITSENHGDVDPILVRKLRSALQCLPPQMQSLYVERLLVLFSDPKAMKQQIEAVTALALANAEITQSIPLNETTIEPKETPEIPLKIAVASLGAFLHQYAKAIPK